jgi:hypothetical protein
LFIFVWRGWGPLAAVALLAPCLACAGLLDWSPPIAMLCGGLALLIGGLVCRHYGRKRNQGTGYHMMYWLPLEYWGWIYIVFGAIFFIGASAGFVKKAVID